MADDVIIRAEGLGKKYLIGHRAEREHYVALRDVLAGGVRNLWRKAEAFMINLCKRCILLAAAVISGAAISSVAMHAISHSTSSATPAAGGAT